MRYTITTTTNIPGNSDPVSTFEKNCITNVELYKKIHEEAGTSFQLLENRIEGDTYIRKAIVQPPPNSVPAPVRAVLGAAAFGFKEETTYSFRTHEGVCEMSPLDARIAQKIKSKTKVSLRPSSPSKPRDVIELIDGEITANIRFIGNKIEKDLVYQIKSKKPIITGLQAEALAAAKVSALAE